MIDTSATYRLLRDIAQLKRKQVLVWQIVAAACASVAVLAGTATILGTKIFTIFRKF